jgi:hypothetical protein
LLAEFFIAWTMHAPPRPKEDEATVTGRGSDDYDDLARELRYLAKLGLVTERVMRCAGGPDARLRTLLALQGFNRTETLPLRVAAVVDAVADVCHKVEGSVGNQARALFGAARNERELPYNERLSAAAAFWASDDDSRRARGKKHAVDSFRRRGIAPVVIAVELKLLERQRDASHQKLNEIRKAGSLGSLISDEDDAPNKAFLRLAFHARMVFKGLSRFPSYTDWSYTDLIRFPAPRTFRVFTNADSCIEIEAVDDSIAGVEPLGVNINGYQVHRVHFDSVPPPGGTITWSIRKRYLDHLQKPQTWLSLAQSQPEYLSEGTLVVQFDREQVPARVERFITPRGTLPQLRGYRQRIDPAPPNIFTAPFNGLAPWHSHGIYWWW